MDDLSKDQLKQLAQMTVPAFTGDGNSVEQLARAGVFVVHCYATMLLAEAEKAKAAKAKAAK